ncbi:MAG TPA: hypothetical protein VEL76_27055, partial [Gemmataceae bacterium]|nr:hypothetical protein [Gemmataceae bacterium]
MSSSWRIGKAFGIGLYIHWTFWLLPLWVTAASLQGGYELALSLGVLAAAFGCVLLHELGHALTARQFGIGTRDITLYPI